MSTDRAKSGPMSRDLAKSLRAARIGDRDAGGVALARRLAYLLDTARGTLEESAVFADLAPKYLAVLSALGLTPAGRGVRGGVQGGGTGNGKLDELRERRQRGAG
ncbi:terminase small subunit [Actinokineospora sp.]|uniref:terminase small subunit n=1 Tax=Actinokineospora sp. TaxID=1872133 RepID=UPI003D6A9589